MTTTIGKAKFIPNQNAVTWKVAGFPGQAVADISVIVNALAL